MAVATSRPVDEVEEWTCLRLFEFCRYFAKVPPLHVTAARLAAYFGVQPAEAAISDFDEVDAAMSEQFSPAA